MARYLVVVMPEHGPIKDYAWCHTLSIARHTARMWREEARDRNVIVLSVKESDHI
jgi:hypothetical protein